MNSVIMYAHRRGRRAAVARLCAAIASIALTFGVVGAAGTMTAQAQPGCTLAPTDGTVTVTISSPLTGSIAVPTTRTYNLYVPPGLSGDVPLLIANHGFLANAENMERGSGWSAYAREHHFIVAYSQTLVDGPLVPGLAYLGNVWYVEQNSIDVAYLKNVVADISGKYCIDPKRVYNTGHSQGSIMAQRMACDAADIFAAVGSWAGADPTFPTAFGSTVPTPCTPSRPIAVGIFQGQDDPYSTDEGIGPDNIRAWTARNGCPTAPTSTSTDQFGTTREYVPCRAGITEVWRVMVGVAHQWPGGSPDNPRAEDLRNHIWNYLTAHPMP
ncbi:alpha/beta hydrolase family esterase [Nocardia transvalensis]|uniref:alpha/beta hydrolase family esterase n=1 Tax=Nocardia transvalensis TaxID=37333 RepID=UPI0018934F69|nr:PHB depolymerase family esterase [Nocardia transvalensis]MBF6327925.1 hypothetical protein [Nocardia transvalensis]